MLDEKHFIENIKNVDLTNENSVFDNIIIPFVAGLNYEISFNNKIGTMIINTGEHFVEILPDEYSNVILLSNYKKENKIDKINENTILINFNLKDKQMELMIDYFGEFVPQTIYKFQDSEEENSKNYNLICMFLSFEQRKEMKEENKKTLIYRLKLIYDFKVNNLNSELLKQELNELLSNNDIDLIKLLSQKINEKSLIKEDKIYNHLLNILKNQTTEDFYKVIFSKENEKENIEEENAKIGFSARDVFKLANEKEEKIDKKAINLKFKQR